MKLCVATCQFPVSGEVSFNLEQILAQMQLAASRGAHVAHFPETALSGYAGHDFESFAGYDWEALESATGRIMAKARELGIWVLVGSAHRLSGRHRPHNSVYIINAQGRLVDRYDKRFCTGDAAGRQGDLRYYQPGDHASVFRIRGVGCGVLICHDCRYPELYREFARSNVQVAFHSFYNGHMKAAARHPYAIHGVIIPRILQAEASRNNLWISGANTSRAASAWGSFMAQPDGRVGGKLPCGRSEVLITEIDPKREFYDASRAWRGNALRGVLHSGRLVKDPRSAMRRKL